jgi:hypothetical protein
VAQNVIYGSLAVAGGMIVASILDIVMGYPFGGHLVPDIIFLIAAAAVMWMGIDCLKGMRKKK